MLSVTLDPIAGFPTGQHPLVKQMMKGCFNIRPLAPKYSSMRDPDVVLEFMVKSGDNDSLKFASLSKKLVTALALATLLRVSEIASIDRKSVCFSGAGVTFSLSKARKTQSQER
jgi:hypothetical protein